MAGNHQSWRDVIVSNNGTLLKSGSTSNLAVGQIGIFGYDPLKDLLALAAPNFSFNKAIQFIQGTPEVPTNALGAIANETKKSKPIKGKLIKDWKGRKAERGQNQIVAIGYDGVDETKTLTAKCQETHSVWLKLSGGPIDQAFHAKGKGIVRLYNVESGCCDDCGDDCANVAAEAMADDLVNQINNDPIFSLGGKGTEGFTDFRGNRFVTARKVVPEDELPTPDSTCQEYLLSICDSGDASALGAVQAAIFPSQSGNPNPPVVSLLSRSGSTSTYQIIVPVGGTAPNAFSNAALTFITDCPTCPVGYTLVASGFVYKVERQDAGTPAALTTLISDYGVDGAGESASRLIYEYGQSTYIIVSATEISAAVGQDELHFVGESRNTCVITSPTLTPWVTGEVYNRYNKVFTITLKDNSCGTSRLTELQDAYPDFVISETAAGECVRKYSTTVLSNCVPPGCPADAPQWVGPQAYNGTKWTAAPLTPGTFAVGVIIETSYIDRVTGECAFDFWRYDAEPVVIEISQHNQDYNEKPTRCTVEWPVTEIQSVKLPIGVGSRVREEEAFFKGYERKYRDENPIVRELQDSVLQTDPHKFYDQYTLSFEFKWHQSWFTEQYTDTYRLEIYVPEGQGKELEAAINGYVSSLGIDIEPVVL